MAKQDIKVSVIIPVYNAEKYIAEALNSALSQTLKEIEIICIDDYSKDDSVQIIEDCIKKDNRIKLIKNSENKKLGYSRNKGLEIAKGEYVSFLDSDDFIDKDFLEVLYNLCIKNGSEIAYACMKSFKNNISKEKFNHSVKITKTTEEAIKNLVNGSSCDKLFKKSFLDKHGIKFPESVFYEDNIFTIKTIIHASCVSYTNQVFYYYRENEASITRNKKHAKKLAKDTILVIKELFSVCYDYPELKPLLRDFIKRNLFAYSLITTPIFIKGLLFIDTILTLDYLKKPFKYFIIAGSIICINIYSPLQLKLFANTLLTIFVVIRLKKIIKKKRKQSKN